MNLFIRVTIAFVANKLYWFFTNMAICIYI